MRLQTMSCTEDYLLNKKFKIDECDLHRHDQGSSFDGFDTAARLAKRAKEKGLTALGLSNHGNTSMNIQHYFACKEQGIKPIMGVECYFDPVFNLEKLKQKKEQQYNVSPYHLCLFAKSLKGYENINEIMTQANLNNFYSRARVDFPLLEKYKDGVICTSACLQGYIAKAIREEKTELAVKAIKTFKRIFADDFYIEIQPYEADGDGQYIVNDELLNLADKYNVKCIMTSDSHYGDDEDYDTFYVMHEMKGNTEFMDIEGTYKDRAMPRKGELANRFLKMHKYRKDALEQTAKMLKNMHELIAKVDGNILDKLTLEMPVPLSIDNPETELIERTKAGLKNKGKLTKKYWERAKYELDTIITEGYAGYFLIVQDYAKKADEMNIVRAPRGSVCNSIVAYALNITDIDSLKYNLNFDRFLRKGKKKIPDIDMDFDESRQKLIDFLIEQREGCCAQVRSYGKFQRKLLLNDLFKVCSVADAADKAKIHEFVQYELYDEDELMSTDDLKEMGYDDVINDIDEYNEMYNDIIKHFYKMIGTVKYFGGHAGGVAMTNSKITKFCALERVNGKLYCVHDLVDLELIGVVKFDILGVNTIDKIKELRELAGIKKFDESILSDKETLKLMNEGDVQGVFQFDKDAARDLLVKIDTDCFLDVVAANAMNRPAALKIGMPDIYAQNKKDTSHLKEKAYWPYVADTYGCIIYQEQVLDIAVNIGGLTKDEADLLVKMEKSAKSRTKAEITKRYYQPFKEKFIKNSYTEHNIDKAEAEGLFDALAEYGFNKGHATGYAQMSMEEAYFKAHFPGIYWYVKAKFAMAGTKTKEMKEATERKFMAKARMAGMVIFTPHVNNSDVKTTICETKKAMHKGLCTLMGVGEKAGEAIVKERKKNGEFKSLEDFEQRLNGDKKVVNKTAMKALEQCGCLQFNEKIWLQRHVIPYNADLYNRGLNDGKKAK